MKQIAGGKPTIRPSMTRLNNCATANRRHAGQSDSLDNVSAPVAAKRAELFR